MRRRRHWGRSLLAIAVACGLCACASTKDATNLSSVTALERAKAAHELLAQAKEFASYGDYVRAEQYAEFARQNGANADAVTRLLLEVCIADQRYRAAIEHGRQQLKRNPDDQSTRLLLATLHAALGEADIARHEFEVVIGRHPDWARAHYSLAVLLRDDVSDYGAADAEFREYLRLEPNGLHALEASGSLLSRVP